jgi:hypothetical protein
MVDVDVETVDEVPEEEIEENRVTVVCHLFFPILFGLISVLTASCLVIRCHRNSSVISVQRRGSYAWECSPICDYEKVGVSSALYNGYQKLTATALLSNSAATQFHTLQKQK